jgi:hypothetical protein
MRSVLGAGRNEVKPPDCQSSLEKHGQRMLDFPVTGHIFGRRVRIYLPHESVDGLGKVPVQGCWSRILVL